MEEHRFRAGADRVVPAGGGREREVGRAKVVGGVDLRDPGCAEEEDGEPADPAGKLREEGGRALGRGPHVLEVARGLTWTFSTCWIGLGSVLSVTQISPSDCTICLTGLPECAFSLPRETSTRSVTHATVTAWQTHRNTAVNTATTLS